MNECNQSQCDQLIKQLYLYLDNELSSPDSQNLLSHLNICPKCLEQYQIETAYKNLIKQKCNRKYVKSNLIIEIKNRINLQSQA